MKFVKVDSIPPERYDRPKQRHKHLLNDFLLSDMKFAKVVIDEDEYGRIEHARISLTNACRKYGYPIDVKTRDGDVYLVRREEG